ncbi:hypothetical protein SODALDRAFT_144094 [Sodiomyces alkalinus F11]|uniref:Uncharacterized protein n=1 Tax=Sodiomyces alkalinus (strain CBS 110278 / VKM F-3762 / F11) TaxID=1314773 RepID=A0A3N2PZX0_SODAK|nr:hypothetical protein SODALDRAFT_144094 [Sodiomyces alkalinus F11]ROT40032.1 hypothetical protein SODALDRAFT_144094 [Sodiomyces alkalinus F11]
MTSSLHGRFANLTRCVYSVAKKFGFIAVIPAVSISSLPSLLVSVVQFSGSLQADSMARNPVRGASNTGVLLGTCVKGPPLSDYQTSALAEIAPDLQHLAKLVATKEGKAKVMDCLGTEDGERLLTFACGDGRL